MNTSMSPKYTKVDTMAMTGTYVQYFKVLMGSSTGMNYLHNQIQHFTKLG